MTQNEFKLFTQSNNRPHKSGEAFSVGQGRPYALIGAVVNLMTIIGFLGVVLFALSALAVSV